MVHCTIADLIKATFLRQKTATCANRSVIGLRAPLSGESGQEQVHAGGAFVRHELDTHDDDMGHDQRWRERPRPGALGPPPGQDSGFVHAIVGSATATPAPVATAAQSAASRTRSPQLAAMETLERGSRSRSHQG
jgi:hypothetical protein